MVQTNQTDAEQRTVTVKLTRAKVINGDIHKAGALVPLSELEAVYFLNAGDCTLADETDQFFADRVPPTVEVQEAERRVLNEARDEGVAIQRENIGREHARGNAAAEADGFHLAGIRKHVADDYEQDETSEATTADLEAEVTGEGSAVTASELDQVTVDFGKMNKADLLAYAGENGIDATDSMTKAEIREAIEGGSE